MTKRQNPVVEMLKRSNRRYKIRLNKIAAILEHRDSELIAADGPVPQDPPFLRRIYKLAKIS